jgi:hypothetical protein
MLIVPNSRACLLGLPRDCERGVAGTLARRSRCLAVRLFGTSQRHAGSTAMWMGGPSYSVSDVRAPAELLAKLAAYLLVIVASVPASPFPGKSIVMAFRNATRSHLAVRFSYTITEDPLMIFSSA